MQIGIVVEDIDTVKQGMRTVFGLEPDAGGESLYRNCLYRNKDQTVDALVVSAFYNFFNIQLEFLQPVGDTQTVWRDYVSESLVVCAYNCIHYGGYNRYNYGCYKPRSK